MASSYTLSTQGAKRSARGCNMTRRGCNCTHCTRLATGLVFSFLTRGIWDPPESSDPSVRKSWIRHWTCLRENYRGGRHYRSFETATESWAQIDPVVGAPLTPNKQTKKPLQMLPLHWLVETAIATSTAFSKSRNCYLLLRYFATTTSYPIKGSESGEAGGTALSLSLDFSGPSRM